MQWNINGLNNVKKFDEKFWDWFLAYDIIGLTETWQTSNALCADKFGKSFKIFDSPAIKEKSKGRPSGGITILINKNLEINIILFFTKICLFCSTLSFHQISF